MMIISVYQKNLIIQLDEILCLLNRVMMSSDSSIEKKPSIKTEIEIENDIIIQTTVNGVRKEKNSDMDIEESVIVQEFTNLKRINLDPITQKQTNCKRLPSDSSLFSKASTVNERPDFDKVKSLPVEKIPGKRKRKFYN